MLVIPKVPLTQDRFQRAVADNFVNGCIDFGLESFITFAQTDVVSASLKRREHGVGTRVIHFHWDVHQHGIDTPKFEITVRAYRIGIAAKGNILFLHKPRCSRIAQRSDEAFVTISERVNIFFVASHRELQLENVVGLAEKYLLLAIRGWFQAVDDDVE